MALLDVLRPEVARLFAAKDGRRRELAALPFPEKVRVVIRRRRMAAPVPRGRGKPVRAWPSDDRR